MIKNVKWNNHPILGDLELDFTKEGGEIYDTIIFAGENGTGKTTILETLAAFLNLGTFEPFERITYMADGAQYTISRMDNSTLTSSGFHHRRNDMDGTEVDVRTNKNNSPQTIEEDQADLRHYGFAYSKARSGFSTKSVSSITTSQLDIDKRESDMSEDFTSIKQLLIDIETQDNQDWRSESENHSEKTIEQFNRSSRMYRFKNAFDEFFDSVKFKEVDNHDLREKKILFEKYGKTIAIDNLSTGEKQIVFRGSHLLKNINSINGGIVLIDEPELSMHPKWQQKILQYYRSLFTINGMQSAQIFVATHSEYVLKAALEDRGNVLIIVLKENNGVIESNRITAPMVLPSVTAAETNYVAFDILSSDYHIELYGYLQTKTGNNTIKGCDDFIASQTPVYNPTIHAKVSQYTDRRGNVINYATLPTYIRNQIDHPNPIPIYTSEELKKSTELLIELCK